MMLALHGRESHVEGWLYVLAERLHKTVQELRSLPMSELVEWQAYFTAKGAIESTRR